MKIKMKGNNLILAVALMLLIPLLSGCMLVVAGGAGVEAGYIATQKEQTAGEVIDDQWITAKIKTKMLADPDVKALKINVDTEKGVVTLTGNVNSQEEMEKIAAIIKNTKGIKKFVNNLKVE